MKKQEIVRKDGKRKERKEETRGREGRVKGEEFMGKCECKKYDDGRYNEIKLTIIP